MTALDVSSKDNELVLGRWGDSTRILRAVVDWYEPAGVDVEHVVEQKLHPIAHYAALLANEEDTDDLLPADAIHVRLPDNEPRLGDLDWTSSSSQYERSLIEILNGHLSGYSITALQPAHKASIAAALRLLDSALPALSSDVLTYASRIALTTDEGRIGETMRDFPFVIILGEAAFRSVKELAESLLHEALHSKVIMLERSASIVRDFEFECTDVLEIPWRLDDDGERVKWSVERAFMAHHVYAHLTVFWTAMWQQNLGQDDLDQLRRVCFRAAYLSKILRVHPDARRGMGEARYGILSWLDDLRVPAFDLSPVGSELVS